MKAVTVLGDAMLDCWQHVRPVKVSSEAPVLVVRHDSHTYSAGGAGNAAVNCAHLGAEVILVSLIGHGIGNDSGSHQLRQVLMDNKVDTQAMVRSPYVPTIHKLRIVDDLGRHLLRVDTETLVKELDPHDVAELRRAVEFAYKKTKTLLVSDYGKGTCHPKVVAEAINRFGNFVRRANEPKSQSKFIVVNGKPENVGCYAGADVVVMNKAEAMQVMKTKEAQSQRGSEMERLTEDVASGSRWCNTVVTDGANGLYWFGNFDEVVHIPAPRVDVSDVAGAGDTVCATIAVSGRITRSVLMEAVVNAARVVSQRGTSVPTKEKHG